MSTVSLPGINDYREAMQNPHLFLGDPELKRCKPAWDPKQHQPKIWSGNFAAVFQLQSPVGSKFAIKCFYRDIRNLEKRYAEFDNHLRSRRPGYLVRFQYQPRGILVNGQWFPIVRMEWVEGQRLDEFLQHHLQRPGPQTRELLEAMAQLWHRLASELERDRLAHGDLQHGNVLFIPGNRPNSVKLRLVDYDGVWVPALDTLPSNESGQPNYQHPQRRYGPLMDRFPHLVIYTTLRCLMLDQQLARHFSDQRLVFGQEDYAQPGRSGLFRELWKNCREPNTRNLVGHLILACVQPFDQTPSLQELVPDGATGWVRPLTALQQGQVEEVLRNGSLSPQSSATSVSFASAGLADRSVPNAAPPTGSPSARPQRTAPTSLPPIPVPSGPTARPAAAPLPPTVLAPAPSPSAAPVPQADPHLATLGLVLLLMLYATAVGIVAGAMLAPLYAAVSVFVPFLLLALCLRWTGSKRWPRRLGGVGAVCAALALLVAHFHKWWWSLNCWWFGALVGLAVGGAVGLGNALAAVRAGLSHHLRSGLLHSLAWACAGSVATVLALGWIPDEFAIRPPSFADSWYEARRPSLTLGARDPENGPFAGHPFTIEFEATSPVGRAVHVEWRYAGEAQWQRLSEPKLQIPEIQGDTLAVEFRPVDSKGFIGSIVRERWAVFVPVPTLKITKQDPPKGPVAGDPFAIEFEATSPVRRPVHVEWRYAGQDHWQRLSEPKLQIPEIQGDALAVEFRPVDSKGFVGTVVEQKIYLPVPALKITKQDPPNGPIAGEPFTIEIEATSPVGRAVQVEWRYAGDTQWQRLSEQKLHIAEVKGDALALKFRAVDSKGYSSGVLDQHWDVSFMVRRFTGHEWWVSSVAVTPDGKYVVSGSWDKTVRLWDLATGQEVRRFTGHENTVSSVAVTPDGKYIVTGSGNKTPRLWDLATGKEVRRFAGHENLVLSVAVTPDGKYVVSGSSDKTVRLWDLATGKEVRRFTGHEDVVWSVAVTPDGKYVVSGSGDKTVRLWDPATGKEVRRFTGHQWGVRSVAVTPDGKYVVSGSGDETVRLWDVATGQEVRRFTGHERWVNSVAVTPDGRYVVSGSGDKTVRLWDPATGKEVRRFTGHSDYVNSVAVTPDGRYVVSGSQDKTVRVWYIGDLK